MVEIDKLLFVAYEDYYTILTRILYENMRECPMACTGWDPIDYLSERWWQHVGVRIGQVLLKGFRLEDLHMKVSKDHFDKPGWNMKNKHSLLALSLEGLQCDLLFRENGGGKKFVKTKEMELLDYRLNSTMKLQKKVIFSTEAKNTSKKRHTWEPIRRRANINLSQLYEEKKIKKINKVKSEMFGKYFSKDDYMNSIEPLIYTDDSNCSPSLEQSSIHVAEVARPHHANSTKRKTTGKGYCAVLKNIFCCKTKKHKKGHLNKDVGHIVGAPHDPHHTKTSLSAEVITGIREGAVGVQPIKIARDDEEAIPTLNHNNNHTGVSRNPNNADLNQTVPLISKSQALKDRFVRKEVPWVVDSLSKTRLFSNTEATTFIYQPTESGAQEYDLTLEMESKWDGESIITIVIQDKSLLCIQDFMFEALEFFKKPFTNAPQYPSRIPTEKFNNYPPMVVHLYFDTLKLVLPSSLATDGKISIQCETNLYVRFQYQGDAVNGPGFYDMLVEMDIIRCYEKQFYVLKPSDLATHSKPQAADSFLPKVKSSLKKNKKRNQSPGRSGSPLRSPAKDENLESSEREKHKLRGSEGNTGDIIANLILIYQQRLETKSFSHFSSKQKPDYFTRLSVLNNKDSKRRGGHEQNCEVFIPVILLSKLAEIADLLGKSSEEKGSISAISHYDKDNSSPNIHTSPEQNYNQIFEINIPELVFVVIREYKGEELVRLELSQLILHFRTERKDSPKSNSTDIQLSIAPLDKRTHFDVKAGYFLGHIGINYFNLKYMKFEPFLDQWEFETHYLKINE